jgi:dienelactone hydrolase
MFLAVGGCTGNTSLLTGEQELGPSNAYRAIAGDCRFQQSNVWVWCVETKRSKGAYHVQDIACPILCDALKLIQLLFPQVRVVLLGWSMGSATITQAGSSYHDIVDGVLIFAGQNATIKSKWIVNSGIPACIIGGTKDEVFTTQTFSSLAKMLQAELVILEGANHCFSKETTTVVEIVWEWFSRKILKI